MKLELRVRFLRKLYSSEDFSIYSAEATEFEGFQKVKSNDYGSFTISGEYTLDEEDIGSVHKVTIEEDYSSKYPCSYKMLKIHYEFPTSAQEQWKYLKDGNIVPPMTYNAIAKTFKKTQKILDIILEKPEELVKVKGIGEERAKKYRRKLEENKEKAALFTEYGGIDGVGSSIINTLLKWMPSVQDVIKTIKEDPFSILVHEKIGFMTADKFREYYGYPLNDKNRILHGVKYYLEEDFASNGNTYADIFEIGKKTSSKLLVSYKEVINYLAEIQKDEQAFKKYRLKIFGKNITTLPLFIAEKIIFEKTRDLIEDKLEILPKEEWAKNKNEYLSKLDRDLSPEQNEFLDMVNKERISILLGPGGSGKSWVINIACDLLSQAGKTFALFAPTARAAHVMTEYVGVEAKTIHRGLMSYAAMGDVAPFDVLIVDEFSMVDSELASVVLRVMGPSTRLIIVGDDFQLQSVGPGNVLFDLVNFLDVPTVKLSKIFRQDAGSGILDYASELRNGSFGLPSGAPRIEDNDIVFINESNDDRKQEIALKLYKRAYDDEGEDEVLLLTPVNKGNAGRRSLNNLVQEVVNPSMGSSEIVFGGSAKDPDSKRYFRRGDFISVKENNYEMVDDNDVVTEIINGDIGHVQRTTNKTLTFSVNGHDYTIEKGEINDTIDHAWAITIHKSQGGQANEVIIVLPQNSYHMLNSNMIYTAITRAKKKCYVIGSLKGLNEAAKRQANFMRKTIIQFRVVKQKRGA